MNAQPQILRRRPLTVEALRVEDSNLYLVATWCRGVIETEGRDGVWVPSAPGGFVLALVGDWVVRGVTGEFYPATDQAIASGYEPIIAAVSE